VPLAAAAQVEIERLELDARLEPQARAVYARATFFLRNRSYSSPDVLEFDFPAALAGRVRLGSVWDRNGELSWRADEVNPDGTRRLRVEVRAPLFPGKKLVVVVSYDLDLEGFAAAQDALQLTAESARLATTGWYPLPRGSEPDLPRRLRLTVRLPKEWQVAAPAKLKRLRDGTALASYELELQRVEPGQLLFRAGAVLPP
jgi:hypothetical protein